MSDRQRNDGLLSGNSLSLPELRNQFVGERCFIIGNGPSLKVTDLTRLKNEFTVGLNRIYLNYPQMGFESTFYCCVNPNVIEQFSLDIDQLNSIKFITDRASQVLKNKHNTFFIGSTDEFRFNENLNDPRWYEGWTVTYCAMQVAFHLGFSEVILVGVDHYFEDSGEPDKAVVASGPDVNHFHPDYFGKGVIWQYPNLERSEESYRVAKQVYDRYGRVILDATVNGCLKIFEKRDYDLLTSGFEDKQPSPSLLELRKTLLEQWIQEEHLLVKQHPHPHAIFLPTEKIGYPQRVTGLRRVVDIYQERFKSTYSSQLKLLRLQCKGKKRAFVIGNGPSLNKTDLSLLKNEITFGVNGIFLKFGEVGFRPTFYVVEDHLVAEDRQDAINSLSGPIKLFPIYLAYVLKEAEDTIFYNHIPRKSYPHGFDFSTDASDRTYTGCTVTFSCLQLAYYFGFEEIYLIGVDCDYEIPKDVEEKKEYKVATLDMKSDDINHFHPDYFGKGFRWHDPQADKMREAYQEAHKICQKNGVSIYNATVGGKLEVFPRIDYYSLFKEIQLYPKLLLIDLTCIGDTSATGQVKQNLFSRWKAEHLLQVYNAGSQQFGIYSTHETAGLRLGSYSDATEVLQICQNFNPDVIYYRPVSEHQHLHDFACQVIDKLNIPYLIHVMDDWPERLRSQNAVLHAQMDQSLRQLLNGAAARLSICHAMSEAFEQRYGVPFIPIANCVEESDWQDAIAQTASQKTTQRPFTIRYVGSLAADMTLQSVLEVGQVVSSLQVECSVCLEIHTRPLWRKKAESLFSELSGVQFFDSDLSPEDYRKILAAADCLLIAYNFDSDSIRYVKYSMANKLPECLASANPVLVYGPMDVATVAYAAQIELTQVVDQQDSTALREAIRQLVCNPGYCQSLGLAAQRYAFANHSANRVQTYFYGLIRSAVTHDQSPDFIPSLKFMSNPIVGEFERDRHAHFDETKFIAELLSDKPAGSVMIDVGAHYGGSLRHFTGYGWKIYAFEPDPSNRQALMKKVGNNPAVIVDVRAVSDRAGEILPFFTSEESTGISGLSAFRDSHQECCQVVTTTVKDICSEHQLTHIDFLKIDTEGFDLMVLKGVPWDQLQPEVVECEFEDRKTVPLGYNFNDIAQYLVDRGYTVFVSEWHPVIRYGIKHDWLRLIPYPCKLTSPDSWGNLLAFRHPPSNEILARVANQLVKTATSEERSLTPNFHSAGQSTNTQQPTNYTTDRIASKDKESMPSPSQPKNAPSNTNSQQLTEKADLVSVQNGQMTPSQPTLTVDIPQPVSAIPPSKLKLGFRLLKRIARYYKRWPLGVAAIAVGLNSVAMIDGVPLRWAFMGGSTALILLLIGHSASKADFSLEAADEAQFAADRAQNNLNTLKEILIEVRGKNRTAFNRGTRAIKQSKDNLAAVEQIQQQLEISSAVINRAINQATQSISLANQAFSNASTALEQSKQVGIVAQVIIEKAQQASRIAEQASQSAEQATKTAEQANKTAELSVKTTAHLEQKATQLHKLANQAIQSTKQNSQSVVAIERSLKHTNSSNVVLFQPFNRLLSNDHISTFENFWFPALNLNLNVRSLGYLAHRICLVEDSCSGRLATSVEDMMLRILVARSVSNKALSVLEIGSLFGINLGILYETCRDYFDSIDLNAIDPLDGYYGESKFDLITNVPVTRSVFEHNMRSLDIPEEDVTLIQGLSTDMKVLEAAGQQQYNLFVIDGDHSYEGVKFDFEHYLAAIDVGGYIIFDDYSTDHWPDIADYVDNEVKGNGCVEFVGSSWRTAVFKVVRKNLK